VVACLPSKSDSKFKPQYYKTKQRNSSSAWHGGNMPIILALWRLKQEDFEFKAILGYIASSRPI
jgi:hypothetical protein